MSLGLRYPVATPIIGPREREYVLDAVASGWVSSKGPYLEKFEREFANHVGVPHAITVANGTVALHLVLHALGIGPGDEVLVPDLTFVATAHAVLQVGATPVLVDVEPDTWCMSPSAAACAITPRTKAIIPVHLYGHPADMDSLAELARRHDLLMIEDAAEATGAAQGDQRVGGLALAGCFSFYGNKLITTGEGGMITTRSPELAHRIRKLRDHGMTAERPYFHEELAFNYRMTNLQAALGLAQVEQLDSFIEKKRQIRDWYNEELNESDLTTSIERSGFTSVFWMYSIVLSTFSTDLRDRLRSALLSHGIDSRPFFVPMSQLPHMRSFRTVAADGKPHCPVSARLSNGGLNLPSSCALSHDDVKQVATTVKHLLRESASFEGNRLEGAAR